MKSKQVFITNRRRRRRYGFVSRIWTLYPALGFCTSDTLDEKKITNKKRELFDCPYLTVLHRDMKKEE